MLTLTNRIAIDAAIADLRLDHALRVLLASRVEQLACDIDDDLDFGDIAHLHVVRKGDQLADVEAGLGIALAGRHPPWEWVDDHDPWIEAVLVVSDDGFGHVLFVQDDPSTDPALLALLRMPIPSA